MKKKSILAIAAVCAAAACFGACVNGNNNDNGGFNRYDEINRMFNLDYSEIAVTITDTFDSNTELVSTYTMTYSGDGITVKYDIERVKGISLDTATVETERFNGTAVIKDGVLISDDKGMIDIVPVANFKFKEDYFANVNDDLLDIKLEADVKNPNAFMGTQISCKDMKVVANYFYSFSDMQITYTAESGNAVKINYVFTA